jgi:hypothetical protein
MISLIVVLVINSVAAVNIFYFFLDDKVLYFD